MQMFFIFSIYIAMLFCAIAGYWFILCLWACMQKSISNERVFVIFLKNKLLSDGREHITCNVTKSISGFLTGYHNMIHTDIIKTHMTDAHIVNSVLHHHRRWWLCITSFAWARLIDFLFMGNIWEAFHPGIFYQKKYCSHKSKIRQFEFFNLC